MATLSNDTTNDKSMNGLVTIDANSISTDELDVDTLVVNLSATAPTVSALSNDTNIATTAWVNNHASGLYVTLATTQTVTGQKTFSNANTFITGKTVTDSIQSSAVGTTQNLATEQTSGILNIGTGVRTGAINLGTGNSSKNITLGNNTGGGTTLFNGTNVLMRAATFVGVGDSMGGGIINIGRNDAGVTTTVTSINNGSAHTGAVNIASGCVGNAPITIGSSVSTTQTATHNALTTFNKLVVVADGILQRWGSSTTGLRLGKTNINEITAKLLDSLDTLYFQTSTGTSILYMNSTEIINSIATTFSSTTTHTGAATFNGSSTFNNDILVQQSTYPSTNTSQLGYNKTETLAEFTFTADTLGTIGSFTVPSKGVWSCNISVKYRTTGGAGSFENVQLFLAIGATDTTAYRTFEYFDETDVIVGANGKRFVHTISGTLNSTTSQTFYIRGLNDTTGITTLAEATYTYTRVG